MNSERPEEFSNGASGDQPGSDDSAHHETTTVLVRGETIQSGDPNQNGDSKPRHAPRQASSPPADQQKRSHKDVSEEKVKLQSRLPALGDDAEVGVQKEHLVARERQSGSVIQRHAAGLRRTSLRPSGALAGVSDLRDEWRKACVLEDKPQCICGSAGHSRGRRVRPHPGDRAVEIVEERARSRPLTSVDVDGRGGRLFRLRSARQVSLSKAQRPVRGTHQLAAFPGLKLAYSLTALRGEESRVAALCALTDGSGEVARLHFRQNALCSFQYPPSVRGQSRPVIPMPGHIALGRSRRGRRGHFFLTEDSAGATQRH